MTLVILSSLLLIGLILLLVEVLFIPGTTVVGVIGLGVGLAGIAFAFLNFEAEIAWWITAGAILANLAAIVYGFKSGVWNRFSLKTSLQGGTFDGRTAGLEVGMKGKTLSDLKPFGKASFGELTYEVKSETGFIQVDTEVSIVKIGNNKIIVN